MVGLEEAFRGRGRPRAFSWTRTRYGRDDWQEADTPIKALEVVRHAPVTGKEQTNAKPDMESDGRPRDARHSTGAFASPSTLAE